MSSEITLLNSLNRSEHLEKVCKWGKCSLAIIVVMVVFLVAWETWNDGITDGGGRMDVKMIDDESFVFAGDLYRLTDESSISNLVLRCVDVRYVCLADVEKSNFSFIWRFMEEVGGRIAAFQKKGALGFRLVSHVHGEVPVMVPTTPNTIFCMGQTEKRPYKIVLNHQIENHAEHKFGNEKALEFTQGEVDGSYLLLLCQTATASGNDIMKIINKFISSQSNDKEIEIFVFPYTSDPNAFYQ